MATSSYWLFKTEPETYSFETLLREKKTNWDQVRNFQARNFLRNARKGDAALIYHSGKDRCVVGTASVLREAYPDVDPEGGDWVQIDLKVGEALPHPVLLADLKADPALKDLLLIRQSRLSCMPLKKSEYDRILALSASLSKAAAKKTGKKK